MSEFDLIKAFGFFEDFVAPYGFVLDESQNEQVEEALDESSFHVFHESFVLVSAFHFLPSSAFMILLRARSI